MEEHKEQNKDFETIISYGFPIMLAIIICVSIYSLYWLFKIGIQNAGSDFNNSFTGTVKTPQLSFSTVPSKFT